MGLEIFILAAFLAMLCWGFADFFIQRSVRKIGDVEALAFIGLIGFLVLTPFVLPDLALLFIPENLFIVVGFGLFAFVVAMFNFEALKEGKLSVIDVVLEIELPIAIIIGFFLFIEFPSVLQLFLIIPIFVGIILISFKKSFSFKKSHLLEKGVLFAFAAGIGLGFIDSFTGLAARSLSPLLAIWVPWAVIFFVSMLVVFTRKDFKKIVFNAKKFKWLIIAMGLIDTIAWVCYAYSMAEINIGIATAITESYPVIGIILGVIINREKITKFQIVGAVLTIVASILLAITLL
ncbi:MAG: DMT family transporter [Candidatus Diapherotrites archaeon]|nr:DMT family transporter [Candidatus Diapherotrites archaeon]